MNSLFYRFQCRSIYNINLKTSFSYLLNTTLVYCAEVSIKVRPTIVVLRRNFCWFSVNVNTINTFEHSRRVLHISFVTVELFIFDSLHSTVRLLTHVLCKPTHFFFHSFIATMPYCLQTSFNSQMKDWADKYHVWGTPTRSPSRSNSR